MAIIHFQACLAIFQFLCIRDWLSCAEVCSSWRDLIQSSALWSQVSNLVIGLTFYVVFHI
uniref:F-box domain-containing protein n=1 Tax=Periophthalmus magnuspinnatus TaxID=409849 RepID=A0A3B4BCW1_9GOBI